MKKRIIAMGVAAAMGGFAGSASAQVVPPPTGGTATVLEFNPAGVGHILLVPYFSTQSSNVTLLNITNTDTINGKVVKVRFRGASNSDDIFDFQLFLSPGDMWSAEIRQSAGNMAELVTQDKSCTLPANVNRTFDIRRTSPQAADPNNETREGYIELLTMADIVDTGGLYSDLYDATKHVDGVPSCDPAVLTALKAENRDEYMSNPTTGLMANWTIMNVQKVLAYSGDAAAIEARVADGTPATGNLVYWDQRSTVLVSPENDQNTADPLLRGATPAVQGARYDLPDLSTPYTLSATSPFVQARQLSDAITTHVAAAEFFNLSAVGAATDWVVSFPTRRYFAAVKYGTTPTVVRTADTNGNIYFTAANTELGNSTNGGKSYQICSILGTAALAFWDREETPTITDDIVISPGVPESLSLCGEVSVVGVNGGSADSSATFATVARSNGANGFNEGWGAITTPSTDGLPFLARQFTRVSNTITNVFYGYSYPARIVEKGTPAPFVVVPAP